MKTTRRHDGDFAPKPRNPVTSARPAAALLLAAALSLGATPALAGPTEDAKVLFDAGRQAFEKGDFVAALRAFEPAYRLAPRPGILFSIAQAHRKQYYTGGKHVEDLRAAIAAYKDYLTKVEHGGRRSDAAEALADLEAAAAKLDPAVVAATAAPAAQQVITRIVVNTQISDAQITLDGNKPSEPPLVADVAPGKHTVRVTAPGYFDEARDVPVAAGQMVPLDVPLREKPAHLAIRALDGSQITLDGRLAATTPLAQPLDVPPGRHLVSVTHNGYRAVSQEIELGRDEARDLQVKLDATVQRTFSYVVMGSGLAALGAAGALLGVAVHDEQQARSFEAQRQSGTLSCGSTAACQALYAQYQSSLSSRDDFRRDAAIVGGAGVLVGAVGIMLFAFDQPTLSNASRRDEAPKPDAPAPSPKAMDASVAPLLAPGFYGAALGGRF